MSPAPLRFRPLALVSVVLLASACGPSQEELDAANSRADDLAAQLEESNGQRLTLEARLTELTSQNNQLANRLRALGENVEELQGQRSSLEASLEETRRALEELRQRERQARSRLDTFRQLLERFRAMIESGQLRVRIINNRMVVELPEGVLFDSGQADLKEEGQATLAQVATILAQIEGRQFQVAGHTDNVPLGRHSRFGDNWGLSTARAVTVTTFLVSQGLPANRVSAAGYADTQPVATNETPEGRAQNRRIEITLLPNLDELPDLSTLSTD